MATAQIPAADPAPDRHHRRAIAWLVVAPTEERSG
jgi:hypothetical protein